jgi:putative SOS response-associated peptidase YedK
MGLAGLWGRWRAPDARQWLSFTMLTVNADGHAVFGRMHRPGEEKRMVAILDEAEFDRWLDADPAQARSMLAPYPADRLVAEPAPRPPARGPAARPAAG